MKESDVGFLMEIVDSLDEVLDKLEHAYNTENLKEFNKAKKTFLNFQNKIEKIAR